jgi:hypothetical protein
MSSFANPQAVEAALRVHLMTQGRMKAFVNVQQVPGKKEPIYIITTESSLASLLQSFLEARIGRRCPYVQGSFLVHGAEAERLLG